MLPKRIDIKLDFEERRGPSGTSARRALRKAFVMPWGQTAMTSGGIRSIDGAGVTFEEERRRTGNFESGRLVVSILMLVVEVKLKKMYR